MTALEKMTLKGTIEQLRKRTKIVTLGDEKGVFLALAPEYGARVVGMTSGGIEGDNLLWINPKVMDDSFWSAAKRDWNLGGARSWIAPEDQFYLDKDNKWFVPGQMDPGSYTVAKSTKNSIVMSNEFTIANKSGQPYHVRITRDLSLLVSPPAGSPRASSGVKFVGMKFTHRLVNLGKETIGKDIPYMGLWSLIQIPPGGTMIIPVKEHLKRTELPYRDYFNPIPPERMSYAHGVITVKIDGVYRSKYGIAPWGAEDRLAFLSKADANGQAVLFIKEFTVEPKGTYLDHPGGKPSAYGDAVQMYNDDGKMGGFAEIECHGPSKVLAPSAAESHTVTVLAYTGRLEDLKKIASKVLRRDIGAIKLFEN